MNCEKILTISIASYNVEKYIKETLDSLLLDDKVMDKLEIIVVDDGSSDHTAEIASEYKNNYPNCIRVISKENGGYGSTINASLKEATGKYYKLLDGDDWFFSESLADFILFLEKCEADLIITPFYKVFMPDKRFERLDNHPYLETKSNLHQIEFKSDVLMHEIAVKTDVLRSINRPITRHCFYTDNEFTFNALAASKVVDTYKKPVYCYRLGLDEQSVSLTGIRKHYQDTRKVALSIFETYAALPEKVKTSPVIRLKLLKVFDILYSSHMLLEKPGRHKRELMGFDRMIKEKYPDLYMLSNTFKRIRFLRKFHFMGYSLLCRYVLSKH